MLMDLLMTKTESAQTARETIAAVSPCFRGLLMSATDRVRLYDTHLEHVSRCTKSVGCDMCLLPGNAGFSRLLTEIKAELEFCDEQLRRDLAPWIEQLEHLEHIGDKMLLASGHVKRLTEKFHAAVAQLEDDRLAVQSMLVDPMQESHLRTAYDMCDQAARDAASTAAVFARAGEGHLHGATMVTQTLTPQLLAGTSHQPHCDTVHMMMRGMVAERFRRMALELDSFTRATTRAATARRAEIMDAMFKTVSL
jgi:hypothetical protein